jgi:predicted nucleotidyltransferase
MSVKQKPDAIAELAAAHGRNWASIGACAHAAADERARITELVKRLVPADCSFLVFGSLARDELTRGSDVDWALLIDGAASPQHLDAAKEVARLLRDRPPGPTQVFGCPIFSHDLVHLIGGDAERCLSMRVSESVSCASCSDAMWRRIVAITPHRITRFVFHDSC